MGAHTLALLKDRSTRTGRSILALILVATALVTVTVLGTGTGVAAVKTGYVAPWVINGGADVDGDSAITASDDSTGFFGATNLKNGYLDCDAWGTTSGDVNDFGDGGDGNITLDDDCVLRGFVGTSTVTYVYVVNGRFTSTSGSFGGTKTAISNGTRLPAKYQASGAWVDLAGLDWAWYLSSSAGDEGKVDYDHSGGAIETNGDDDRSNFIDTYDIDDGKLDIDGAGGAGETDGTDDCVGCFFGYDVVDGLVQSSSLSYSPAGSPGVDGEDGVSGRDTFSKTSARTSVNKSATASCSSSTAVFGGGYVLIGADTTLAHLTVVSNGPVLGGWRVRVIEATPTSGTWAIRTTAICAEAA